MIAAIPGSYCCNTLACRKHVLNSFFFVGMCSELNVKCVFSLMRVVQLDALFWYVYDHWLESICIDFNNLKCIYARVCPSNHRLPL